MKHIGTYFFLFLLLFVTSCGANEETEEKPGKGSSVTDNQILIEQADFTSSIMERVKQFQATTHPANSSRNGIYVYSKTIDMELYNQTVHNSEKLDGVMADLEPHTLKSENEQAPEGLDIYWDSNNHYGIGKENDQLLKRTLNILQRASFELSPLKLKESVSFLYQPKYDEGRLSYGSATQFLQQCESVHVMAYYNRAEVIWNRSLPLLEDANKLYKNAVSVCVKVSVNTYGDG